MAVGQDVLRFMNEARVRLPGATDDAMQLELFAIMDDFFKGSNVWQEDIDITIPANDPAGTIYDVVPSSPSTIDKLMWVFQAPTQSNSLRGPAVAAAMQIPGQLTLHLQPSSQIVYRVTVALTVQDPVRRDGYVTFPAWVLSKYRSILIDGIVGRMAAQPNKPFTNSQLTVYHTRKFNTGIATARVEATRNNTYRQQAWRFPGFVRGSQHGSTGWAQPQ
jgi:hypothetical protein